MRYRLVRNGYSHFASLQKLVEWKLFGFAFCSFWWEVDDFFEVSAFESFVAGKKNPPPRVIKEASW